MLFTNLNNYVVFDLEMNGSNQIIEIGAIKVTGTQNIEKFSVIVNNPPVGSAMKSFKYITLNILLNQWVAKMAGLRWT